MRTPSTRPHRTLQRLADRWLRDEGGRPRLIVLLAILAIFLLLMALAGGQDKASADTTGPPHVCYAVAHGLGASPVVVPCTSEAAPVTPPAPAPEAVSCTPAPAPEATPVVRHRRHRRFAHGATLHAPR